MVPAIFCMVKPAVSWRFSLSAFLGTKMMVKTAADFRHGPQEFTHYGYDGGVIWWNHMKSGILCRRSRNLPPAIRFLVPFCSLASWSTAQWVCLWLGQSIFHWRVLSRFLMTCTPAIPDILHWYIPWHIPQWNGNIQWDTMGISIKWYIFGYPISHYIPNDFPKPIYPIVSPNVYPILRVESFISQDYIKTRGIEGNMCTCTKPFGLRMKKHVGFP